MVIEDEVGYNWVIRVIGIAHGLLANAMAITQGY